MCRGSSHDRCGSRDVYEEVVARVDDQRTHPDRGSVVDSCGFSYSGQTKQELED